MHIKKISRVKHENRNVAKALNQKRVNTSTELNFYDCKANQFFGNACRISITDIGLTIVPNNKKEHASVLLGGGKWKKINQKDGWKYKTAHFIKGSLSAEIVGEGFFQLFCLMFNDKGELLDKKYLGPFHKEDEHINFSYRPSNRTMRYNLAVYVDKKSHIEKVTLKKITLLEYFK